MTLWFETHATSIDNERGIASGHLDVPLSERGVAQAVELGARYACRHLALVYSSDLRRAAATAEIAFANTDVPRVQDQRLRECDYGAWSACPVQRLEECRARFVDKPFPGGESYRSVVRRVVLFLAGIKRGSSPVLIIGHRATWYSLEHLIRGTSLTELVGAAWQWQPGWEYDLSAKDWPAKCP